MPGSPASSWPTIARRPSTGDSTSHPAQIAGFQDQLAALGYRFQFITLAGWHLLNYHTFDLARAYSTQGMAAYSGLQDREFASEVHGYTATKHQAEVGAGYFDQVMQIVTGGQASTLALVGSTEAMQFV